MNPDISKYGSHFDHFKAFLMILFSTLQKMIKIFSIQLKTNSFRLANGMNVVMFVAFLRFVVNPPTFSNLFLPSSQRVRPE